jgi:general secretion pathway protein H
MPTSAAGNSGNATARGFTLLELIIVIAIIAIATASVSFAMRDSSAAKLDREADRLAALLESARAQSRASGVAVRWRPVEGSFVFDGLPVDAIPSGWVAEGITAQAALGNGTLVPCAAAGARPDHRGAADHALFGRSARARAAHRHRRAAPLHRLPRAMRLRRARRPAAVSR